MTNDSMKNSQRYASVADRQHISSSREPRMDTPSELNEVVIRIAAFSEL